MNEGALDVLLLSDATDYGGGERYLETLAAGFDRAEVRPRVALAPAPALDAAAARLAARGISVVRLPPVPVLSEARAWLRNFGHFAWRRPRILHANLVDPRACNGAIVAAAAAGIRAIVATEHLPHSPFDDGPTPLRHRLAAALVRRRIALTEPSRAALLARGVPDATIDVVPNGVPDPGPPSREDRAAARATLVPSGRDGPVVAFVGRLAPQKRPEAFLDVAERVAIRRPDASFVLVGDGPLAATLAARVAASTVLAPRTRLLGRREDVLALYPGMDLLVALSRYEGQPLTLLEAGLREVPVVAGRIAGVEDLIADGETGRLVPPDDADAAAAAVVDLLDAPERRKLLGFSARLRMLSRHSAEAMVRGTVAVYRRAVGAPTA